MYYFPSLEPVCFPMFSSNYCFLTCIQTSQEAGQVVWYSYLFKDFPQFFVTHIVKGFGLVHEAEVDVFMELSCFSDDPTDVGSLISSSSAFLNPGWTSRSSRITYCWRLVWRILIITLLVCDMSAIVGSLNILWHCLSLGLEWRLTFSSPVATAEFSKFADILSATLSQHHILGWWAQVEFHPLH